MSLGNIAWSHAHHAQHLWEQMWPSPTKWGCLRGISKLRIELHCNKCYFLHILMQKGLLLWYSYQSLWNVEHHLVWSFKTTSLRFELSKKQVFHNTSFLRHFHWKCVCYDEYLGRISKMKHFDLGSYFCLSNQFQYFWNEPHLVMLGHICNPLHRNQT